MDRIAANLDTVLRGRGKNDVTRCRSTGFANQVETIALIDRSDRKQSGADDAMSISLDNLPGTRCTANHSASTASWQATSKDIQNHYEPETPPSPLKYEAIVMHNPPRILLSESQRPPQ